MELKNLEVIDLVNLLTQAVEREVIEFNDLSAETRRIELESEADKREIKALKVQIEEAAITLNKQTELLDIANNNVQQQKRDQIKVSQLTLKLESANAEVKRLNEFNPERTAKKNKAINKELLSLKSDIVAQRALIAKQKKEKEAHVIAVKGYKEQITVMNTSLNKLQLTKVWNYKGDRLSLIPDRMKTINPDTGKSSIGMAFMYTNQYNFGCIVTWCDHTKQSIFSYPEGLTLPSGELFDIEDETKNFADAWMRRLAAKNWAISDEDFKVINSNELD